MNHRLQLSPISRGSGHWPAGFSAKQDSLISWENARFFRSWLVYDSGLESSRTRGRINWNIVMGLIIMAAVSASGWYGVSVLVRHLLRIA
jgi:hypothetical protein